MDGMQDMSWDLGRLIRCDADFCFVLDNTCAAELLGEKNSTQKLVKYRLALRWIRNLERGYIFVTATV